MRVNDGSLGAAVAGALLIGLPAIDLLWARSAPQAVHLMTALLGFALLVASAAGVRLP